MFSFHLLLLGCLALATQAEYFGDYTCEGGSDVIVHLFEWKWSDIANECEEFLGPAGYCGVQLSPPAEHAVIGGYPWWQRYQPAGYDLNSRSGWEGEFGDMVDRCNNAGVRIYADIILNHMTGGGSGTGSGGSWWSGDELSYPAVPYGPNDFHGSDVCFTQSGEIENYQDANQVRNCRLVGLRDMRMESDYVRGKQLEFLNKMIGYGVAGFRVDAAKHMWPGDMEAIFNGMNDLPTEWFPAGTRPYIFNEVIDQGGEPIKATDYTHIGRVTEFKYSVNIGEVFRKNGGQQLKYLKNFGEEWGFLTGMSALVFIDNHDNQRGHGAGGQNIITHQDARLYKMANAYELAYPYGHVRIMSSYYFDNTDQGPPSDGGGNTNSVTCFQGWACEHRWRQISNMVNFHNVALGTGMDNWWDNGGNAIAFGRGNKGFIVINNEDYTISETLQTGLPAGTYCDVITCEFNLPGGGSPRAACIDTGDGCRTIEVGGDGYASFNVDNGENPMVAIHV